MMMNNIEKSSVIKFLNNTIYYLILATLFLVPVFFNTYTYITFEIGKVVLFRTLTEVLLVSYLFKMFLAGEVKVAKNKFFYLALFFIFFSQLIATIFSEHAKVAFWGSYWHGFGLFTAIHLFIFIFILFNEFVLSKNNLKKFFYTISASSFLVCLYGIAQVNGFDLFEWQGIGGKLLDRASSTLGQPNYLAAFILLVLPIAFYLFSQAENKIEKTLLTILIFIEIWTLLLTYSRAAWLGAALTVIIFLLAYLYRKNKLLFNSCLILFSFVICFYSYLSFVKPVNILPNENLSFTQRIKSLANSYQGSSILRTYYYETAFGIIKTSPLIGHGLDTGQYYFFKGYKPDYAVYEAINKYPDRAHNELLDILITTGILGFSAWVYLFFILGRSYFLSKNTDGNNRRLLNYCFFGLLAFFISNLFGFFNIVTVIYFWLLIIIMLRFSSPKEEYWLFEIRLKEAIVTFFLFTIVIFNIFIFWNYNFKVLLADYYFRQVKVDKFQQNYQFLLPTYQKIFDVAPTYLSRVYYEPQLVADMVNIYSEHLDSSYVNSLEMVKNYYLNFEDPDLSLEDKMVQAKLLAAIGEVRLKKSDKIKDIKEFEMAEKIYSELSQKASGFANLYYEWGNLEFKMSNYAEALSKYYQSVALYPDINHPDMNLEHRQLVFNEKSQVYSAIATTMAARNNFDSSESFYKKALFLNPWDYNIKRQLEQLYISGGDVEQAIRMINHSAVIYPKSSDVYFELANIYKFLNKKDLAIKNIKIAIKIDKQRRYEHFLEELEGTQGVKNELIKGFNQ